MRDEPLRIEDLGIHNDIHSLRLIGPLTISTLYEFQSLVRTSAGSMVLDFTQVPYVDSAGVGALVGAYFRHNKDGHTLTLAGVNNRVRAILGSTGVEQFFTYADSLPQTA